MGEFPRTIPNLAAIRENHGLSLNQIAQSTNISVYYLRAIEKGDIQKLPKGVYARSYIRQYARAIDFNEHDLLAACGLAGETENPVASPPPPEPRGLLMRLTAWIVHAWQLARGSRADAG